MIEAVTEEGQETEDHENVATRENTPRQEGESSSSQSDEDARTNCDPEPWDDFLTENWPEQITSYGELRAALEEVLGRDKDPGMYRFHDKTRNGNLEVLAHCHKHACIDCTKQVKAKAECSVTNSILRVWTKGTHGELAPPKGGRLWNAAEMFAIKQAVGAKTMTSAAIKKALKDAALPVRCDKNQLYNYVGRSRSSKNDGVRKNMTLSVAELQQAADEFMLEDVNNLVSLPDVAQLVILPSSIISTNQVCVIWTSSGMLQRATAAQNKLVKFVVDGKQKVLANEYAIMTLSFLVSSDQIMTTTAPVQRAKTMDVYTSTQEPFLQALVDSESAENMSHLFTTGIAIAKANCKLDLETQVIQIHKDYSKGIEKSRKECFGNARPCDDFPHMRRASYKKLEQYMPRRKKSEPQ